MNNGPFEKLKQKRVWLPLALIAGAILVAVVFLAPGAEEVPGQTQGPVLSDPSQTQAAEIDGSLPTETGNEITPTETDGSTIPDSTGETDTTAQQPPATEPDQVPSGPADVVQRVDAEYEKWLSAALVVGLSMEYPDFELEGIYGASATPIGEKFSSSGAWILFSSGGTRMAIHSVPLKEERTEHGTSDISSEAIGFATFDRADPDLVDLDSMEQLPLEELGELIEQSLLVSIYTR